MGHHITTVGTLSAAILALAIGDGQSMAAPRKARSARPAPAASAPAKPSPAPAATIDDLLDLVAVNGGRAVDDHRRAPSFRGSRRLRHSPRRAG